MLVVLMGNEFRSVSFMYNTHPMSFTLVWRAGNGENKPRFKARLGERCLISINRIAIHV